MNKFNQDISYWYNNSTKHWYCNYNAQMPANPCKFDTSDNEAKTKQEILEICETMARWYHAA